MKPSALAGFCVTCIYTFCNDIKILSQISFTTAFAAALLIAATNFEDWLSDLILGSI